MPEWKLSQYNDDPLQKHECFEQFSCLVGLAALTDDVKLAYLTHDMKN